MINNACSCSSQLAPYRSPRPSWRHRILNQMIKPSPRRSTADGNMARKIRRSGPKN